MAFRSDHAGEGESAPLSSAPRALIVLHGKIGVGKEILWRLLTDRRMDRSWATLACHIKSTADWHRLWGEIVSALHRAKRVQTSRAGVRDEYLRIADTARKLAATIKNGQLDRMIYEYAPDDVMCINGVRCFSKLDSLERAAAAGELLRAWPCLTEVLDALSVEAAHLAERAMSSPAPIERRTRDAVAIVFMRTMAEYFRLTYGRCLYGTVAAITSIALNQNVSQPIVAQAVRRKKQ